MAIPQRTLCGVCEISTGALTVERQPVAFTGEVGALRVQVRFTMDGKPCSPDGVAEMYLYHEGRRQQTVPVQMTLSGDMASGNLRSEDMAVGGCPLLVVQLKNADTGQKIVTCDLPMRIKQINSGIEIVTREATPGEIVYVGRAPYIDEQTGRWMVWDNTRAEYVDSSIEARGPIGPTPRFTVTAESGDKADVQQGGTLENPTIHFILERGKQGETGPAGKDGEDGKDYVILGPAYETEEALRQAVPKPNEGDRYEVGTAPPYDVYRWTGEDWVNEGKLTGGGGEGTVKSVCGVEPDESGDVPLTAGHVGALYPDPDDEGEMGEALPVNADTLSGKKLGEIMEDVQKKVDAAKEDVVSFVSNPDLLINSRFRLDEVINQRGETTYGTARQYAIDCWEIINPLSVTLEEEGLKLAATEAEEGILWQVSEQITYEAYDKSVFTYSVLTSNGELFVCTGIPDENWSTLNAETSFGRITLGWRMNNTLHSLCPRICVNSGKTAQILAAKLELGDRQTLARQEENGKWVLIDPPPNKALELLKCQRYQLPLQLEGSYMGGISANGAAGRFFIPTPCQMRKAPTITAVFRAVYDGGSTDISLTGSNALQPNGIEVRFTCNATSGIKTIRAYVATAGMADANL